MGNHYHLLLKTPGANISRYMRYINGVYTQCYNRLKKTDGPLFRGRFKSILIEQDDYLAVLTRYIHRSPVDMKKPLATKLHNYRWSSYRAYINFKKPLEWLYRDETYGLLGYSQRYKGYRIFTEAGVDEEIETLYGKKNYPAIIGSKGFKDKVYAQIDNADIFHGKRGKRQIARWMAMRLWQILRGMSLKQIAQIFYVTHISSVSHSISQLRKLQEDDSMIDAEYQVIYQYLTHYDFYYDF